MAYPGAIGIDLGTTYSCVAVSRRQGRAEVIADNDGIRKVPGYLAFKVGEPLTSDPTPVTLEGMLVKMKRSAEAHLGKEVTRCVLTVPVHFDTSQCQQMKDAAAAAGMVVLDTIAEPVAAAIACGLREKADTRNVVVFDLGGGACAATVLAAGGGECTVRATARGPRLSGEGLDGALVEHFVKELRQRHRADIADNQRALRRLRVECELAKRTLSKHQLANLNIEAIGGIDLRSSITRARWEDLCGDRLRTCVATVKEALAQAGVEAREVDDVILVGGGTRIPKIRALLGALFGRELRESVNPDEAVAEGAALACAAELRTPPARRDHAPAVTRDEAEDQLRAFMPPRGDAASKEVKARRIKDLDQCFRRVSRSFHTDQRGARPGDFQHLLEVRRQVDEALALWQVERVTQVTRIPDAPPQSPPTPPADKPALKCKEPYKIGGRDGVWQVERLLGDALDPAATTVVIHKKSGGAECRSCRGGKGRQSEQCAAWGCDGRRRVPVTQCLWMPPLSMPRPDGAPTGCQYFDRKPWDETHAAPEDGQPTQFHVTILTGAEECGGWRYDAGSGQLRTTAQASLFSALLGGEVRFALPRGGELVGDWGDAAESGGEFVFPPGTLRTADGHRLQMGTVVRAHAPAAARAHVGSAAPLPEPVQKAKARFDDGASLRDVLEEMAKDFSASAQLREEEARAEGAAIAARLQKDLDAQSDAARKEIEKQTANTREAIGELREALQQAQDATTDALRRVQAARDEGAAHADKLQKEFDKQRKETVLQNKQCARMQGQLAESVAAATKLQLDLDLQKENVRLSDTRCTQLLAEVSEEQDKLRQQTQQTDKVKRRLAETCAALDREAEARKRAVRELEEVRDRERGHQRTIDEHETQIERLRDVDRQLRECQRRQGSGQQQHAHVRADLYNVSFLKMQIDKEKASGGMFSSYDKVLVKAMEGAVRELEQGQRDEQRAIEVERARLESLVRDEVYQQMFQLNAENKQLRRKLEHLASTLRPLNGFFDEPAPSISAAAAGGARAAW